MSKPVLILRRGVGKGSSSLDIVIGGDSGTIWSQWLCACGDASLIVSASSIGLKVLHTDTHTIQRRNAKGGTMDVLHVCFVTS